MIKPVNFQIKTSDIISYVMSKIEALPSVNEIRLVDWNENVEDIYVLTSLTPVETKPISIDVIFRFYCSGRINQLISTEDIQKLVIKYKLFNSFKFDRRFNGTNIYVDMIGSIPWALEDRIMKERLEQATAKQIALTRMAHQDTIPDKFTKLFDKYRNKHKNNLANT